MQWRTGDWLNAAFPAKSHSLVYLVSLARDGFCSSSFVAFVTCVGDTVAKRTSRGFNRCMRNLQEHEVKVHNSHLNKLRVRAFSRTVCLHDERAFLLATKFYSWHRNASYCMKSVLLPQKWNQHYCHGNFTRNPLRSLDENPNLCKSWTIFSFAKHDVGRSFNIHASDPPLPSVAASQDDRHSMQHGPSSKVSHQVVPRLARNANNHLALHIRERNRKINCFAVMSLILSRLRYS